MQCARRILNESLNFQESRSPPKNSERAAGGRGKKQKLKTFGRFEIRSLILQGVRN